MITFFEVEVIEYLEQHNAFCPNCYIHKDKKRKVHAGPFCIPRTVIRLDLENKVQIRCAPESWYREPFNFVTTEEPPCCCFPRENSYDYSEAEEYFQEKWGYLFSFPLM